MFTKWFHLTALLSVLVMPPAFPGDRQGNGGDDVRAAFFRVGDAVITFLKTTPDGRNLVSTYRLDLKALSDTLTIQVVSVSETLTGDYLSGPNRIQLRKKPWLDAFAAETDVYYLVFHLMLEASGTGDGTFGLSNVLKPFPAHLKISTRILVSPDTSAMPYQERLAYLVKRGQLMAVRFASFGRSDLLMELTVPRGRLAFDCPAIPPPGQEAYWKSVLDQIEKSLNTIEARL